MKDPDRKSIKIKELSYFLARKFSLIDTHLEEEGDKFSLTGTLINDKNGDMYNFNYYGDEKRIGLEMLKRR